MQAKSQLITALIKFVWMRFLDNQKCPEFFQASLSNITLQPFSKYKLLDFLLPIF